MAHSWAKAGASQGKQNRREERQWGCFGKVTVCAHELILMAEVQMCVRSP